MGLDCEGLRSVIAAGYVVSDLRGVVGSGCGVWSLIPRVWDWRSLITRVGGLRCLNSRVWGWRLWRDVWSLISRVWGRVQTVWRAISTRMRSTQLSMVMTVNMVKKDAAKFSNKRSDLQTPHVRHGANAARLTSDKNGRESEREREATDRCLKKETPKMA
eukprot:3576463-Rhodomonas_salina.2